MAENLLQVRDAEVSFPTKGGMVRALDGVSIDLAPGETLAVVGESGCGKTTLARAVLGLQPLNGGTITVAGVPIRGTTRNQAERIGMVWQDPYASLNPLWKIGKTLQEPFGLVGKKGDIQGLLKEVGLDPTFAERFPHELSGGQRQRVAIGRALALRPPLVICDEPTAALDLSIQAQILNLLSDLQASLHCAYLYISHDLGTVRYLADRVAVMYLGKVVEYGPAQQVFDNPLHPYTKTLMESAPSLEKIGVLPEISLGELPRATEKWVGCRFAARCPKRQPLCDQTPPAVLQSGAHGAECHFPLEN